MASKNRDQVFDEEPNVQKSRDTVPLSMYLQIPWTYVCIHEYTLDTTKLLVHVALNITIYNTIYSIALA